MINMHLLKSKEIQLNLKMLVPFSLKKTFITHFMLKVLILLNLNTLQWVTLDDVPYSLI